VRRLLLLSGVRPSYVADLTLGYLPAGISFSRAGNAMLTDASGKLTYAPNNLLTHSNDLTNAAWNNAGYTVSPNSVVAPDGTTTASLVTRLASGSQYVQQGVQNIQAGVNTIVAAWAKAGTSGSLAFTGNGSLGTTTFNLNTGVSVTGSGGWVSSGTVNAGGGWWLCYAVANVSSSQIAYFNPTNAGGTGATNSVWHFSVSAVTYETTARPGDQVVTGAAAYYGPRFDHSVAGLPAGLLVEASATNLEYYSDTFSNLAWIKNFSALSTGSTALDGSASARVTMNAGSNQYPLYGTGFNKVSGNTYSQSIYVKYVNTQWLWFRGDLTVGAQDDWASFDVLNGVGGNALAGVSSFTITGAGGGWYRIDLIGTATTSSSGNLVVRAGTGPTPTNSATTYAGTEAFDIFGAQVEVGSLPTSYVPTAAGSVTRAPDVLSLTGAAAAAAAIGPAVVERQNYATGVISRIAYAKGAFAWSPGYRVRKFAIYPPNTNTAPFLTVGGRWQ